MTLEEHNKHFERVKRLAPLITYKPGWSFSVDRSEWPSNWAMGMFKVTLTMRVQDVICSGGWRFLYFWKFCDTHQIRNMDEGSIIELIFVRQIREAEEHEMKEWFRVSDLRVYNPYPENGKERLYEPSSGFDSQLYRSDEALR